MFKGRKLVIATRHQKECVIAPLLEQALGVSCFVPYNLDTDQLGTFSGEVERLDNPLNTAKRKCIMAMEQTDCDLAVASEGSFGPHPTLFFGYADEDLILFMDKKHNLEICSTEISLKTNFNGKEISTEQELMDFAESVNFPSHGLILRDKQNSTTYMVKGITDSNLLFAEFKQLMKNYGSAFAETDMRAMYNPTRMDVIATATQKLIDKINSLCPECSIPSFDVTDVKQGLPCSLCGLPTRSTLSHIYTCAHCSFTNELCYPYEKKLEDPMYCDHCNP